MINIGVIGYGYWGPNLVRNFNETSGINVCQVADLDDNKLQTFIPLVSLKFLTRLGPQYP
jgi:predicted homoserine dehydrogenase-like protein